MNKTGEGVKISVPYRVIKMDIPKRIRLSKVKRNTQRVYDVGTGIAIMKRCGKCGVLTLYKDMRKDTSKGDGMTSWCLNCMKAYYATPEVKERQAVYNAIPENKKRKAELDAERQRNNPEKVAKRNAKRQAVKRNLPNESLEKYSFDTCEVTGATNNVHIEHMIPLDWGHGGTYFANCYSMEGSTNKSKGNRNPFEWYELHGERFGITIEAWSDLIEDMANRNRMDTSEYVRFVNWCFDNPRTLEQIKADNMRYGYIVDSLTLYREAMAKEATR